MIARLMKTLAVPLVALALAEGAAALDAHPLDLRALYTDRGTSAALAPAVEALRGRRVQVRGFMVRREEPLRGAFYLAAHPVEQDESGAGTADLPPASLLVRVPALADAEIPWRPGLVEVVGTLEVGRDEEPDGRVSSLRVILAEPSGR